jgi:nitrogen PTS system EIIA component
MNLFKTVLSAEHVLVNLDVANKQVLFETVAALVEATRNVPRAKVLDSLLVREKLASTGIGKGLAIPHGRSKVVKEPLCIFVKLKQGIEFGAPDGQPVQLAFITLVPDHAKEVHLQLLSEIAQLMSDPVLSQTLTNATESHAAFTAIQEWAQLKAA